MSDRTSAEVFGEFFTMLSKLPDDAVRYEMVLKTWNLSAAYDFDPCQMECDDVLDKLGIARKVNECVDPDGDDYFEREYGPPRRPSRRGAAKR